MKFISGVLSMLSINMGLLSAVPSPYIITEEPECPKDLL